MNSFPVKLPGVGFVILAASYLGVIVLLCYGGQKPRLDRAFEIQQRESAGASLSDKEAETLDSVLADYPAFSRALMGRAQAKVLESGKDGWFRGTLGHLAVRPEKGSAVQLRIESQADAHVYPITLELSSKSIRKTLALPSPTPVVLEFSAGELKRASILKLEVTSTKGCSKPTSGIGLRLVAPVNSTEQKSP